MPTQDTIGTDFESELPGIFSDISICEDQHLLDSIAEPPPPILEEKSTRHQENTVLHEESRGKSLLNSVCKFKIYLVKNVRDHFLDIIITTI